MQLVVEDHICLSMCCLKKTNKCQDVDANNAAY